MDVRDRLPLSLSLDCVATENRVNSTTPKPTLGFGIRAQHIRAERSEASGVAFYPGGRGREDFFSVSLSIDTHKEEKKHDALINWRAMELQNIRDDGGGGGGGEISVRSSAGGGGGGGNKNTRMHSTVTQMVKAIMGFPSQVAPMMNLAQATKAATSPNEKDVREALASLLVATSTATASVNRDKAILAVAALLLAGRSVGFPAKLASTSSALASVATDANTERTAARIILVLLAALGDTAHAHTFFESDALAQLAVSESSPVPVRRLLLRSSAEIVRSADMSAVRAIPSPSGSGGTGWSSSSGRVLVKALVAALEDATGNDRARKLQTIYHKLAQGGSLRALRGKRREGIDKATAMHMIQAAGFSGARRLPESLRASRAAVAINAARTASFGSGVCSDDPTTARHAMALLADKAGADSTSAVEVASLLKEHLATTLKENARYGFGEGFTGDEVNQVNAHGGPSKSDAKSDRIGSAASKMSRDTPVRAINVIDPLCRIYLCRCLGTFLATSSASMDANTVHVARSLLRLVLRSDGFPGCVCAAAHALVGASGGHQMRTTMYNVLLSAAEGSGCSVHAEVCTALLRLLRSGREPEVVAACHAFSEVARSCCVARAAASATSNYDTSSAHCDHTVGEEWTQAGVVDALRTVLYSSTASPYLQLAAVKALLWLPPRDRGTLDLVLVYVTGPGWDRNLVSEFIDALRQRLTVSVGAGVKSPGGDSVEALVLSAVLEIVARSPTRVDTTALIDLWKTAAELPHARPILVSHLLDVLNVLDSGAAAAAAPTPSSSGDIQTPAALEASCIRLLDATLWFLGEHANFICSLYAWNDDDESLEIGMSSDAEGVHLGQMSSVRSVQMDACVRGLVRAMGRGAWATRAHAAVALGKVGVRSCEPFRYHCYAALSKRNAGLNIAVAAAPSIAWLEAVYDARMLLQSKNGDVGEWRDDELEEVVTCHERLVESAAKVCFVPKSKMNPLGGIAANAVQEFARRQGKTQDFGVLGCIDDDRSITDVSTNVGQGARLSLKNAMEAAEGSTTDVKMVDDATGDANAKREGEWVDVAAFHEQSVGTTSAVSDPLSETDPVIEAPNPSPIDAFEMPVGFTAFESETSETTKEKHATPDDSILHTDPHDLAPALPFNESSLPVSSSMARPATVIYDFVPEHESEFSVLRGDKVVVLAEAGDGWLFVRSQPREELCDSSSSSTLLDEEKPTVKPTGGLVPAGYVLM